MKIEFKGKVQSVYNMDDTLAYQYVQVPKLERRHVDMHAARQHPKYGGFANSDLFPAMLARIRKQAAPFDVIKLDKLPVGVEIDTSGFLAKVTINVDQLV